MLATRIRQKDGIFYFVSFKAKDILNRVRFTSRFYFEGETIEADADADGKDRCVEIESRGDGEAENAGDDFGGFHWVGAALLSVKDTHESVASSMGGDFDMEPGAAPCP